MKEKISTKVTNMKNKLTENYNKFEGHENHFNWVFLFVTLAFVGYLILEGRVDFDTVISMTTGIIFNVAMLLFIGFGLQKFLRGSKYDILKEIFVNKNSAASMYMGFIFLALAIVISKGLM